MAEQLPPEGARQGSRGKPVLYVLIASLVLLAVATVGLLAWNSANSPKDYPSQSQDAARKEITGRSNEPSSSNSSQAPAGNPAYPAPAVPDANSAPKANR